MAYGDGLRQLNPLPPELIAQTLTRYCGPGAVVADIGCGRGDTLCWLRQVSNYQLCGIDPEAAAESAPPGVVRGRAEALPWQDGSLDAALLECVFSLLEPAAALVELRRVLKRDGVLLVSDLYGRCGSCELADSALLRHIYTREQLEEHFRRVGFSLQKFSDHTWEMQDMLAQMILDGTDCGCDPAQRAALKTVRAGYGLWVFRAEGSYACI